MPLSPGQKLAAYEIISALGAGGMGEVYRARDARLGRDVALKVLPPDVTDEPGRLERFDREARAIAALNHPHIITIYSTEEADGIRFLTMELVDGCTLSDLVVSSGIAVPRFLDIAIPLADALAAAHQKQITHRDLKPGNVMLSNDGRVKVLDFGLARVGGLGGEDTLIATQAPLTHQGTIVGTMPYMSPEQVEGRPLDARSDLFSLGVMFYELLSGDRPFKGSSSPTLMSAILRDTPADLLHKRADLPDALDRLIGRLLEKRPEDRVQTARDVFNELRHIRDSGSSPRRTAVRARPGNLTVAVSTFESRSSDERSRDLCDGLPGEITNGLSRFGYLRVLAGPSTAARYSLSGQVRTSGSSIRVSIKLLDVQSGAALWSENYDASSGDDFFKVQDTIASRIVANVGDESGALMRSMAASIADVPLDQLSVAELIVRYFSYAEAFRPEEHGPLREAFEHALEREPRAAEGWACLAMLFEHDHGFGYNQRPDTLQRHRQAAERSIALDPRSPHAWSAMATVHLFAQDRPGVRTAVDRVATLNPLNADLIARSALFLDLAGDHDRALELINIAMALKPQHPAYYHFVPFNAYYARGDDERALQESKLLWMPKLPVANLSAAAVAGQLGRPAEARVAIDALRQTFPQLLSVEAARKVWSTWIWDEPFVERLADGFAKALDLCANPAARPASGPKSKPPSSTSGSPRSDALSIAVLPFVPRGTDDESRALADGLTDDITSGLSRFGYLRVLSRSIAERLGREHAGIRGQARYAIEGLVRKSGSVFRTGVTLVDIDTGTNLWTSTYDRDTGAGMLAIQDDVASAAVATIGDQTGVLVRAIAASIAETPIDQLTIAELVIRYHLYTESFQPAEHARLRDAFERRLEREPRAAEGWACLAMLCEQEHGLQLNPLPDSPGRQRRAADRSVELDPRCQMGWIAVASAQVFARDREALKAAVERSVSINPLNADLVALGGLFLSMAGEFERARALVMTAVARKPQHPGWYHFPLTHYHIARGDYESALRENKAVNMPRMALMHLAAAAISGHLGRTPEATAAFEGLRNVAPALLEPANARASWAVWFWSEEFIDTMLEGFMRAKKLVEDRLDGRSDDRSTGVPRSTEQSIAVLPFADLSEKKDQDWFCDGIAEEILNALASLPGLRVAARASAFSFRGKTDDLGIIGEKLNVTTVLEGSVRRAGDRVRITTQLSDARQGRQMWSERFDREMKDIFDVQEEIARAIAERLRVTIAGGSARLVQQTTTNIHAYELLLKGRALMTRRGRAVLDAIPLFEQAIALDSNLAEAHALLGDAYRLLGLYGIARATEVMPKARACIDRALAIDPNQPEALATVAIIASTYEWNIDELRQRSDRAIAADPTHVRARAERAISIACLCSGTSWHQEALDEVARARTLDPLNPWVVAIEGFVQIVVGRNDDAVENGRRAIALDTNNFTAHWVYVWALSAAGREDEALDAAAAALAMSGRHPYILTVMAAIYADRGDTARIEAIRAELAERAEAGYVGPAARAIVAAAAGDWPQAREFLAEATAEHDTLLAFWKLRAWRPVWKDDQCAAMIKATSLFRGTQK